MCVFEVGGVKANSPLSLQGHQNFYALGHPTSHVEVWFGMKYLVTLGSYQDLAHHQAILISQLEWRLQKIALCIKILCIRKPKCKTYPTSCEVPKNHN